MKTDHFKRSNHALSAFVSDCIIVSYIIVSDFDSFFFLGIKGNGTIHDFLFSHITCNSSYDFHKKICVHIWERKTANLYLEILLPSSQV